MQTTAGRRSRPVCSSARPSTAAVTARANAPRSSPPVRYSNLRLSNRPALRLTFFLLSLCLSTHSRRCDFATLYSPAASFLCSSRYARASHPGLQRPPARRRCRRRQRSARYCRRQRRRFVQCDRASFDRVAPRRLRRVLLAAASGSFSFSYSYSMCVIYQCHLCTVRAQYFDAIPVDDERLFDLSLKASLPTPYQILTEYMKRCATSSVPVRVRVPHSACWLAVAVTLCPMCRNSLASEKLQMTIKTISNHRSECTMTLGNKSITVRYSYMFSKCKLLALVLYIQIRLIVSCNAHYLNIDLDLLCLCCIGAVQEQERRKAFSSPDAHQSVHRYSCTIRI